MTRLPKSMRREAPFGAEVTELHPAHNRATMNRLVVISNRVPLPDQGPRAGGLAVALDGLMEKRGGMWFGWSGIVSPNATSTPVKVAHHDGVDYATTDLTAEEHDRYYNGFSNGVLWPLLHSMTDLIQYDRTDAQIYRDVNLRLAADVQALIGPDDLIWVHDYHLLPLPAALRAAGVSNPIGFFLHIPFCTPETLDAVPDDIDFDQIENVIKKVKGVESIHHMHIWAMSTTENALTTHLVLNDKLSFNEKMEVVHTIKHELLHSKIHHATIELESAEVPCKDEEC